MESTRKDFVDKILNIGVKYGEVIEKKLSEEKNHSGAGFEEINDGIRILNHLVGMILKNDI